ncbi:MAG: helix-turn-helix transcriptional regulator [Candidatus Scalindua sp.]
MNEFSNVERFLPIAEVCQITGGKSPRTIYRWIELNLFPKPVKIGPNSVAWPESVIKEWGEERKAAV